MSRPHGKFTPSQFSKAMASVDIGYAFGSQVFEGTRAKAADHFASIATAKIIKKEIGENLIAISGPGATALTLCRKIAMERMGVEPLELSLSALEWGNEWEPIARERYEKENLIEVVPCFETIPHPVYKNVSGTPDGLVRNDGIIEIKCPHNPENHFANLLNGAQLDVYKWQGQGYCWITGRKWFEFVSFDPRFKEPFQLKVIRVERDDEMITQLSERIALLEPIVESMLKMIGYE